MPIFKNELLTKKLEEKSEGIYMQVEEVKEVKTEREKIEREKTERESIKSGRSRIDNIIASILS